MRTLAICMLCSILFYSCKNDDDNNSNDPIDQLPPPTQTGENMFGYLLNGTPISITNSNQVSSFYQQLQLQISSGFINPDLNISLILLANGPLQENMDYSLVNNSMIIINNESQNCSYDIEDTYAGTITFTNIDETNFIISGIFEFSAVTDDCEIINITEGRFDVQYAP
ncbi:hypothetical protein [Psychroserpens mesophilus]|uniref:hypothetical protein n=1 Tax=Psychroserpens mesophilus TaxID=325473 RepID=UPI001269FE99|nr:hypothetical protein [Psychroserpens mesophilus]